MGVLLLCPHIATLRPWSTGRRCIRMSLMHGFIWGPHLGNGESFHSECRFQIFPPHCFAFVILLNESIWFLTFAGLQLWNSSPSSLYANTLCFTPQRNNVKYIQSKAARYTLDLLKAPHGGCSLHLQRLLLDYQDRAKVHVQSTGRLCSE